jgi:transcriptional regulator with XRE-family HTH domain
MTSETPVRNSPRIGAMLRLRRRHLDMTLEQVAEAAAITKGFLSEVERDKASPSVALLVRLCDVLSLPVGSLFSTVGSAVVRKAERVPIKFGGARINDFLLSPTSAVKAKVIFSDISPGGSGGEALYSLNCEEEFVFVLAGDLIVTVDEEETRLAEGDAMTFDPRQPHTFRNASESLPAQALFMLMPPPA